MKKLLIAVAIREELKILKSVMENKKHLHETPSPLWEGTIGKIPVEILVTSMGPVASYRSASVEIDPQRHVGVLVLGFCGGISLTLKPGDAVVASKVLGVDTEAISLDQGLCEELGRAHITEGLNYRCVPLITQNRVLENSADKTALFVKTKAEAVDMESFEIVRAATEKKLPVVVVKVVVDDVETDLPNFNDHLDYEGKIDQLKVRQVLMSQPALALTLSKFMKIARQVLEKSIPVIVPVVGSYWEIEKTI